MVNSSNTYNYYEWNRVSRQNAAQHVKADTRVQPRAQVSVEQEPQLRVVANVGCAMLFSAAHLHSTVQNTCGVTRYSIDFRTVHLDDVWHKCGAPNIDSAATGTTMRDYLRATDFTRLPDEAVALSSMARKRALLLLLQQCPEYRLVGGEVDPRLNIEKSQWFALSPFLFKRLI